MVFEYDEIVIGSSLSALIFAYINKYPVFFTEAEPSFRFDFLAPEYSPMSTPSETTTLNTFDQQIQVGTQKQVLWDRLLFVLSLRGLVPLSSMCYKIRYDGDSMVCTNEYSKIFEATFNKCHFFGDNNTEGFVRKNTLDEHSYLCYDHIAFNSGGKHEIDFIYTDDDFVSEIWFYSSDRIDGNTPVRDACAVSKLTGSQLVDFDYSETMARFKVLKIMKDNGMRGKQSGYTKKGTPRHYDFKTTSIRRETSSIRGKVTPTYSNIQIQTSSEKSLLRFLQDANNPCRAILEVLDVAAP